MGVPGDRSFPEGQECYLIGQWKKKKKKTQEEEAALTGAGARAAPVVSEMDLRAEWPVLFPQCSGGPKITFPPWPQRLALGQRRARPLCGGSRTLISGLAVCASVWQWGRVIVFR